MPAAALTARVSLGRCCPSCTESVCADPAECLYFLTSRPWADCDQCAGSGFAGESDPLNVFCGFCFGSQLQEYSPGATPKISPDAARRLAARIDALTVRVSSPRMAVAA